MNRHDLVDKIAAETDSSKAAAGRFLDSLINQVQEAVAAGVAVKINGFGTFERSSVASRAGRDPITGERITIPATVRPRFKPGATFKSAVKG